MNEEKIVTTTTVTTSTKREVVRERAGAMHVLAAIVSGVALWRTWVASVAIEAKTTIGFILVLSIIVCLSIFAFDKGPKKGKDTFVPWMVIVLSIFAIGMLQVKFR